MYAVYYAVKKLEYLLSDTQFTWRTGHKNNTFSRLCSVSDTNEYVHPLMDQMIEEELNLLTEDIDTEEIIAAVAEPVRLSTAVYSKISKVYIDHHGVERTSS